MARRRNWGEDPVYYHDEGGELGSLPTAWTDVAEVDPFVMMAAGRSPFRVADLRELADLVVQSRARSWELKFRGFRLRTAADGASGT